MGAGETLARLVVDVPDFPEPGMVFKDITPVLADHAAFTEVVEALAAAGRDDSGATVVDAVVGMEARGFILAAPVALALGTAFVPVRKAGKLPRATYAESYSLEYGEATLEMHRDALGPGDRVLLVDDVLATGGTVAATVRLIEAAGAVAVGASVLMELELSARSRDHRRPAAQESADRLAVEPARRLVAMAEETATPGRRTHPRGGAPCPWDAARPAGPDGVADTDRQPGAGAAVPDGAGQPPEGRPGPARAGLPHRREATTATRCARAATRTSPTRSPSPPSWPTSA